MNASGEDPERLLSSALRAQASGNSNPVVGTGRGFRPTPSRPGLPVLQVLLFALVLGLVAGGLAGVISLL